MKKIVVIGGGFAGSLIAKKLEGEFDVTLIDTKNYFEFTPWIMRTIVDDKYANKIQIPHSSYLKKTKIVIGEAKEIKEDYITVNGNKINFDYLAICSGSRYEVPFKEKNVVIASRANHLKESHKMLKDAKQIVVVGGGIVGVELAAEILDEYEDKKVIIVHSGSKLMERNNKKSTSYAEKYLKKRGAIIIYEERAISVGKKHCITNSGRRINADMVFLCTGIKPNYEFFKGRDELLDEKNQIRVNLFLQVNGKENMFAAGDVTAIIEEKTAQNAERQALVVVKNIRFLENGEKMMEYKSKRTPQVISLGMFGGIFEYGDFVVTGIIPAFMKWAIKKKELWKKLYF